MTDPELVRYFIENIEYEHKGLMLDTGHLLNTNLDINTEEEGIDYLIETVKNLGDMKDYIKGIHLNNLIEMINPKYLVYEFITTSLEELSNFIKIQDKVLGL